MLKRAGFAKKNLHAGKLASSRKFMGNLNYAINRQRIGIPRGELLAVFQLFTENLPDGVRFREATAIKTWKRLELQPDTASISFVLLPLFTSQQ